MRDLWKDVPFEAAIEKVPKTAKIPRKRFLENGQFPVISQEQDFVNGRWDNPEDVFDIASPVIVFGDHTQVLKYVDFDFVVGADGVKILQPISAIHPKYFYYYLMANPLKSLGYARHYRLLKEIRVKFPESVTEQKRIVAILDEAFGAIARAKENAQRNLANARELFDSYLNRVFTEKGEGWEEYTLGEACVFSQGIQVAVKLQSETKDSDNHVRFLRIVDFTQGNEPPRYIASPEDKFLVRASDVSLVRYGASTGFVCTGLSGAIANNLFRVMPRLGSLSQHCLFWFLRSDSFQGEIRKRMHGVAMPAISFGMIGELPIAVPTEKVQEEFVRKLTLLQGTVAKSRSFYRQKLTSLEELKQSILQKAFTGQLTTKSPELELVG